jgi:predicted permease
MRDKPEILFLHALRMALRGLRRTPGIAVTGVLTLGFGLTATVILLGVWLGSVRPLPVPEGEEIVRLQVRDARANPVDPTSLSPDVLDAWERTGVVEGVAGWAQAGGTLVSPRGPAVRVSAAALSPGALQLLQVPPIRGRLPTAAAEDRDAIVLGAELWSEELGGDPGVIGSTVRLDGRPLVVVGIMPAGFGFPTNHDAWTVLDLATSGAEEDRKGLPPGTSLMARLAEGVEAEGVAPALEAGLASSAEPTGDLGPYRVEVAPWGGGRGDGDELLALGALGVLVVLLLVVCAANVSTLLLVRATERVRTLAVHAALGAGRAQVVLQLFLEALLVAVVGGVVGLAAGSSALAWIEQNLSAHWGYYWMRMELRPGVILGTLAALSAAALVAGTAPALMALRADLRTVMGRQSGGGGGTRRTGRWFIGVQVALSTTALVAAVVMGRGLAGSGELVRGLPLDEVAVGVVAPPEERYPDASARDGLARELREALVAMPGVSAASVSTGIPHLGTRTASMEIAGLDGEPTLPAGPETPVGGRGAASGSAGSVTFWSGVDASADEVYPLTLLAGRGIEATDGPGGAPVVVVNQAFVRRFLAGGTALGARVRLAGVHGEGQWATVIGVVEDLREERPGGREDRVFVPLAGAPASSLLLSARAAGDLAPVVAGLREAVATVDPDLAVEQTRTLRGSMEYLTRMPRTLAGFGTLGGVAGALVAAIGLYGIVAFRVRSGLREVGIRMALGAPARGIVGEILAETVKGVLPAVVVGLAAAFAVAPALAIFSFGYRPRALTGFAAAAGAMVAVAVLASLRPALRASRLDPNEVLRTE